MFIYPISSLNGNNYSQKTTFKSLVPPKSTVGRLKHETVKNVDLVLLAYKDIISKLEAKSLEGIRYIQEKFPNVTIGEGLIFHNCGAEKSSILIHIPKSLKYSGLTRIIERQSSSAWGNKIVKNSYLLENNEKILDMEGKENQVIYPTEKKYYSDTEIKENGLEESLNRVLADLSEQMLSFRIFLNKNKDRFVKMPSGKLSSETCSVMQKIQNLTEETNAILQSLPPKVSLEARHLFEGYKMVTGSPTHVFENIGDEKVKIKYHPINSHIGSDFSRLSVFDSSDKLLQTFVVSSDGKMVKNLNQNFGAALPSTPVFADEKEILAEEFKPTYEKYLNLYFQKILNFNMHVKDFSENRLKKLTSEPLILSEEVQVSLDNILVTLDEIQKLLKSLDSLTASEVKKNVDGLYAPAGRKGLTFDGFEGDKRVFILPVKSKSHSGLVRLTITKPDGKEELYLIKDGKYIVKNFNPAYPQVIPPSLILANQADEMPELSEALNFMAEKVVSYKKIVETTKNNKVTKPVRVVKPQKEASESLTDKKIEEKSIKIKKRKQDDIQSLSRSKKEKKVAARTIREEKKSRVIALKKAKKEKKDLLKACNEKLKELKMNINNPVESFDGLILELRERLNQYLESKK